VLGHLGVKERDRQEDDEAMEGFKKIMGETLYPALISNDYFGNFTTGWMVQEMAMSKTDAKQVFMVFVVGLGYALTDVFKDPDLPLTLPPHIEALAKEIRPLLKMRPRG
jgi:hypothetical protein